MTTVQRTIEVERAPDEVFAYLADFSNTPEWDPATVSCERLDAGPLRVGARFRYVGRFRGRETDLDYTDQLHGAQGPITIRRMPMEQWDDFTLSVTKVWNDLGYALVNERGIDSGPSTDRRTTEWDVGPRAHARVWSRGAVPARLGARTLVEGGRAAET